jgi:FkbM family methyltransferase
MIEASKSREAVLDQIKRQHSSISYRIALLGASAGDEVIFYEHDHSPTASSVLQDQAGNPTRQVRCRMETLDSVLAQERMPNPGFIKVDVQGYELEVLKGAPQALAHAQAVLLEVSLIDLYKGNPLLHDVVPFMHQRNFQAYDICTLMRRPLDQALIQIDMIFIKRDSPLLSQKIYG